MSLNYDDEATYSSLLSVCQKFAVDPSGSVEAEVFFRALLKRYSGNYLQSDISTWIENQVTLLFKSIKEPPRWIQHSDWQFFNNCPMVFAGQIDIDHSSLIYHDDASIYVFVSRGCAPVIVIQKY